MDIPKRAIFAFNANIDHLCFLGMRRLEKIKDFSPKLYDAIEGCFSIGMQREIKISRKECEFLLSEFGDAAKTVGGQAGNAAQQASLLGVECLLHSNYATKNLIGLFRKSQKIMLASKGGFVPAKEAELKEKDAHHFVFENRRKRTRFIASYDPAPLYLDRLFCRLIMEEACSVSHAFVGGFHLLESKAEVARFAREVERWKEQNPKMKVFCELGEFQSESARLAFSSVMGIFDMIGLNENELCLLAGEGALGELALSAKSALYHTSSKQIVIPKGAEDREALLFARRCASFLARHGRHASLKEALQSPYSKVRFPARTVGLGDTLSCAYFLSSKK